MANKLSDPKPPLGERSRGKKYLLLFCVMSTLAFFFSLVMLIFLAKEVIYKGFWLGVGFSSIVTALFLAWYDYEVLQFLEFKNHD